MAAVEAIASFRVTPNRVLEQLVSSVQASWRLSLGGRGGRAGDGSALRYAGTADGPVDRARLPAGPASGGAAAGVARDRDGGSHIIDLERVNAQAAPRIWKNEATTLLRHVARPPLAGRAGEFGTTPATRTRSQAAAP